MQHYLARDFDTIVNELLKRIETKYGDTYNDFAASSMGMMLVDLIAFVGESLSFYIDRRALESYLATARERANVERLCRQIGYRMRPAVSGAGTISVAPSQTYDFAFTLPAGFQFRNASGFIVETLAESSFAASSTEANSISVREGYSTSITLTGAGVPDQEFALPVPVGKYVAKDSVRVWVDGVEWEEVTNLTFEEGNEFEVWYHQNPPLVRFGNGQSAAIPASGLEVKIAYVVTSGLQGNINGVNAVVSPFSYGASAINFTISQTERCTGGADPEGIDEAKAKAPSYAAARDICITTEDYTAVASAYSSADYGAVSQAKAFVARSTSGDLRANSYITLASAGHQDYVDAVASAGDTISASMDDVDGHCTTIGTACDGLETAGVNLTARIASLREQTHRLKGRVTGLSSVSTTLTGATASESESYDMTIPQVIAAMEASSDVSIVADATHLQDLQDDLESALETLDAAISEMTTTLSSVTSTISLVETSTTEVGTHRASIEGAMTSIDTEAAASKTRADALSSLGETARETVTNAFFFLRSHLDEVLDGDGFSNVISVSILSVDQNDDYTAPSNGLIRSLETYLQERCDVAHVVRVSSGADALVSADITVEFRALTGFIFSQVQGQIDARIRTLLKRRAFGDDLYISQVYEEVQSVPGVDVCNVTIACEEVSVDGHQNLIISQEQVIVPGTILIQSL
jgi:hypothetical protein